MRTAAKSEPLDDDARRRELYAAGQAARKAGLKLLAEYQARAAELADILRTYRGHLATIDQANAEPPEGASRIESPEPFNGREVRPGSYRTVVERALVFVGTKIRAPKGGRSPAATEMRQLESQVYEPPVAGIPHRPLTDTVSLPALGPGASPFWAPLPSLTDYPTRMLP